MEELNGGYRCSGQLDSSQYGSSSRSPVIARLRGNVEAVMISRTVMVEMP